VKAGSRKRKIDLVERINSQWKDLFESFRSHKGEELIRIKKFLKVAGDCFAPEEATL
jgi:hypothetical protein